MPPPPPPPWADEFPNDNPDLFIASEYPPPIPDDELQDDEIEVIDAFEESDFAHAVTESTFPPELEEEPIVHATPQVAIAPVSEIAVVSDPPPEDGDGWQTFLGVMRDVAMHFGAARDVAKGLALTLEADQVARAWRVAIDGGEADFAACGNAMLDEWASSVLAQLTGASVEAIRRELRSRGVCAFGLIAA